MAAPLTSSAAKLDTPPWLQEPTAGPKVGGHQPSSLQSAEEGKAPEAEPQADVPRMILYTRVINLILSICMIVVSLLAMLTTQSATTGVLACYLIVFACLLCCFETHLKQVSKIIALNFGFMYSARARSVFMLFVGKFPTRATTVLEIGTLTPGTIFFSISFAGTILFSFSLFGKIIGICMVLNAFFNVYILFKYPGYEEFQRNDAQSDIKDFLAANPAFAKKMVSASVDIIKSNPGTCRSDAIFPKKCP